MLTKESCKEIVNTFHKSTFDLNVKILTLHTISELSKLEVY